MELSPDLVPELKNRFNQIESLSACSNCYGGIYVASEPSPQEFVLFTFSAAGG